MQAAIRKAQIEKFPLFVEKRKENFKYLYEGLKDLTDKLILPQEVENSDPSWFGFMITVKEGINRNEIVQFLEEHGVQTRMLFAGNITKHPCFDEIRDDNSKYKVIGNLENTNRIMNDTFWIGLYPGMTNVKLDYMIKCIKNSLE